MGTNNLTSMGPRRTMLVRSDSGTMLECEVVHTQEKETKFMKAAPILPHALACICCFLNLIPGLGTLLAAHTLLCGMKCSFTSPCKGYFVGVLTSLLQLASSLVLIGWIWSLMHGVYLVRKGNEARSTKEWNKSVA